MNLGPIDLVYCWCDQKDPAFARLKEQTAARCGVQLDAASSRTGDCRYVSNDELLYSLRSVANGGLEFIRQIHIVMADCQTPPPWLRLDHPRLRIVRHSEFMPPAAIPCFNATSLEFNLPNLPGLSERFLYANDDMFVAVPLGADFFFAPDGLPYFRFLDSTIDIDAPETGSTYILKIARSYRLIRDTFGHVGDFAKAIGHLPHHNVDAYVKSDLEAFAARFSKELAGSLCRPFRSDDQLHRTGWAAFALATGRGHYRRSRRPWYMTLFGGCHRESWYVSLGKKNLMRSYLRIKPKLLCVNDNAAATDEDRKSIRTFLEALFPKPSPFEVEH